MATVGVVSRSLYRRTHSLSRLAWSWVGGRLAPFYIYQMTLAMALPWWQHHKHCRGYYYYMYYYCHSVKLSKVGGGSAYQKASGGRSVACSERWKVGFLGGDSERMHSCILRTPDGLNWHFSNMELADWVRTDPMVSFKLYSMEG